MMTQSAVDLPRIQSWCAATAKALHLQRGHLEVLLLLFSVCICRADVIKFGTSEELTGHIVSVHKGVVQFRSDHFGLLTFNAAANMTISVDGLLTVTNVQGKEYVGLMKPNTGPRWTLLTHGGVEEATLAPEDIVSLYSTSGALFTNQGGAATDTRENTWEGVSSKPGSTGPWSLDSRFSFTGVQGTRNRRVIDWTGELENSNAKSKLTFTAERIYSVSSNSETGKNFLDDDETQGEAHYDRRLTSRCFLYLGFQGLNDQVNFIDHRLIASGGIQYKLWRESNLKLTLFGGPSWLDYAFLPNGGITSPSLNYGAIQVGYTSEFDLPSNTTLYHDSVYNQGYNSGYSFEALTKARVRHMLTHWFFIEAAILDDYNSDSAYLSKRNRLRYTGGLGVKLDRF